MDFEQARRVFKECVLFHDLDEASKGTLLLAAGTRQFAEGDVVFRKDEESGTTFLLVVSGALGIISESTGKEAAVGSPGGVFGEIGILNPGRKRTATVVARSATEVLEWDLSRFDERLRGILTPLMEDIAFERVAGDLS